MAEHLICNEETRIRFSLGPQKSYPQDKKFFCLKLIIVFSSLPKKNNFKLGLTFDDVLLVPKFSKISSRKLINLHTNFSRNIKLNIPIVSANMDTVTESGMAIAMAAAGGIGIIHRFMDIDQQVNQVRRVKRSEGLVISDPITVSKEVGLADALKIMENSHTTSLLVCGENNLLEGILTARDIRFKTDMNLKVSDLMTPRKSLITAPENTNQKNALEILDKNKIEKLPLVDKKGRLVGLITSKDFLKLRGGQNSAKDKHGRLLVGAAVGVKDGMERAKKLVVAGVDALVIDIAHGHHERSINLLKSLKKEFKSVDIVAGNVATSAGTKDLIIAGADAVKVGIGPGAACSTRIVAGAGVPQISAILECSEIGRKHNIPIIADGGIKNSGDLAKAIAAGGSTAMVGNLFGGTKESPGEYFIENGAAFKIYRGLASREASPDRDRAPEGISTKVSYKGEVKNILGLLIDGLQSGMSYSGADSIKKFWQQSEFIRITDAGMRESLPRP